MAEINSRAYDIASIAQLLSINNDGDDLAHADIKWRRLMSELTNHIGEHGGKAKGQVSLTFTVVADAKGVDVAIETTSKTPKRPTSKARWFANEKGDGLSARNPNRETMFPGQDLGRRRAGDPS